MAKADTTLYDESSIESLEPREFVRLRPGVYYGSTEYTTQLIIEAFSNSLDEFNIGHGKVIKINTKSAGNDVEITVEDEGQGFIVNHPTTDGRTVFEDALSVMNTSGKYSDGGVYQGSSLGLNGVGLKLLTFLSRSLVAKTYRDGQSETLTFKDGIFQERTVEKVDKSKHGTILTFIPDPQFFTHVEPEEKVLKDTFDDITALCPGLTVIYNDQEFSHQEGIEYLLKKNAANEQEIVSSPLVFSGKIDDNKISCGLTYTTSTQSKIIPYVNYGLTDSGPHITTLKKNVTAALNRWARENNVLKKADKNLDGSAFGEGLVLAVNLVGPNVSYDSQLKSKVVSNNFNSLINETFGKRFEFWLDSHQEDAKIIVEKAITARKAAEAAKKARERVRNNGGKKVKNITMPTSLTDAWSKDRSKCELYIAEGLSAGSGLIAARNSEFQAIYSVRGKMLSVQKATPENIYKNKEINNLITALGLDVNPKTAKCNYDPSKLRYGKIIAAADAE